MVNIHEKYIRRCIELAKESFERGDNPFGSVIVCNDKIIAESGNYITNNDVSNHAEIMVMRKAQDIIQSSDLSNCTIYSNVEPCPMCAFMMRELKFNTVVFALSSPDFGGYSKWDILQDRGLENFKPVFSTPPNVITGVLEKEAREFFDRIGWLVD